MSKKNTDSSVEIEVQLTMTEEYNTDMKVTRESVIEKIENLNENGYISNYEDWELTDKMWEVVTNDDELYKYRTHQIDYYVQNPTPDNFWEVEEEVINEIVDNLKYKHPNDDQYILLTESKLLSVLGVEEEK
tara:strand:- start:43 stop:438 length:396 start_codon:yes stop_codon:yes gene_type:complete